ncbi:site-specific integrase [Synechococcus sp. 1G10]|uniref:site-specific integrase n=1 Tax=Synechococcus sp. 1G10 TaxID=2025605 RepID=UPI000B98A398|nr:site-specific integrase [Synechococcus sp. 1G10]
MVSTPSSELGWLTHELRQAIFPCPFRYEWSNTRQGLKLLLSGDWGRRSTHTTRTIQGIDGQPIRKGLGPLTTTERQLALAAGQRLVRSWLDGGDTRQRRRPASQPCDAVLDRQRRVLLDHIRARGCGFGRKRKLLRHGQGLFTWLDLRSLALDSPNAIAWAGDGVARATANYSDRLFVAQWAIELNGLTWVLPKHRRAQTPKVKRAFTEAATDADVETMFLLIQDPVAQAFCRVVAATGCRPSEVAFFDWESWERQGRPMGLQGFSPKVRKEFVAAIHPRQWLTELDPALLRTPGIDPKERSPSEEVAERNTRHSSRLLKSVHKDLAAAGFTCLPTWTDLRHLWTIRAQADGMDRKTAALAQAHSERMAAAVYLRHGEKRQVLAGIERFDSLLLAV